MKFDGVNLSSLKLDDTAPVQKTYTTSVQNNNPQDVRISADACKKSVRVLSRLNKRKKKNKSIG